MTRHHPTTCCSSSAGNSLLLCARPPRCHGHINACTPQRPLDCLPKPARNTGQHTRADHDRVVSPERCLPGHGDGPRSSSRRRQLLGFTALLATSFSGRWPADAVAESGSDQERILPSFIQGAEGELEDAESGKKGLPPKGKA